MFMGGRFTIERTMGTQRCGVSRQYIDDFKRQTSEVKFADAYRPKRFTSVVSFGDYQDW